MVALVIGSTGLVGSELTNQLLGDDQFEIVKIFGRRSFERIHPKLEEYIINFDRPDQWRGFVKGDVLFSALGTTLKQAGSKGAQFNVDYKYQYNFAKAASENGVTNYVLVSAAGSSPRSKIFYSRMKGILEKDIKKLPFNKITILKPGQLVGDRKEKRLAERISISLLNIIRHIPGLRSLKPIAASIVASAMVNSLEHSPSHLNEYSLGEVFKLSQINKPLLKKA